MQLIRSRVFICFIFLSFFLNAQVINERDNELDKKYTPPQSSLFNNLNVKNNHSSSGNEVEIQNAIKFCPTLLLRQKVVFFYEREITKGFNINGGLGKAFGEDPFEKIFLELLSNNYENKQLSAGELLASAKYDDSSPFIAVGFRIYYSGNSFDGGFVDFNYRYERRDYILNPTVNNGSYRIEGSNRASFKINAFSFGLGHTFVGGQKNNITHELFLNFGIKLIKFPEYKKFDNVVTQTGNIETVYRRTTAEISARILPSLSMGYVFGFGF
jgi:hypothetical protein